MVTTTDPGTISVPMSSILDALEGVLTDAERTALFEQLIGLRPAAVAPGDLITAELFNQMLSDINDLSVRVASLEGIAGGPILDSLDPPTTVAVNGVLIVSGRNFNPDRRFNTVKIGDVEISQFRADSTPNNLVFPVPDMFTGLPDSLPVRVITGGRTSNAMPITVVPQDKTQGGDFLPGAAQTGNAAVKVGDTLTITWPVQAVTLFEDNATLSLVVGSPVGATAAAWLATAAFQPTSLQILPGATKPVQLTVKVPTGASSAQLSLKIVSQDGHVTNISDPVAIKVGDAVVVSDPRTAISYTTVFGGFITEGTVTIDGADGQGLLVQKNKASKFKAHAVDTRTSGDPANYAYSVEFIGPANGLTVDALLPAGTNGIPFGQDGPFDVPLKASAASTTGATARIKIICNQTKTGANLTPYTSFRIIPVKIVD